MAKRHLSLAERVRQKRLSSLPPKTADTPPIIVPPAPPIALVPAIEAEPLAAPVALEPQAAPNPAPGLPALVTLEPQAPAPAPVVAEPAPVGAEPAPVAAEPAPVVAEPAPVVAEPAAPPETVAAVAPKALPAVEEAPSTDARVRETVREGARGTGIEAAIETSTSAPPDAPSAIAPSHAPTPPDELPYFERRPSGASTLASAPPHPGPRRSTSRGEGERARDEVRVQIAQASSAGELPETTRARRLPHEAPLNESADPGEDDIRAALGGAAPARPVQRGLAVWVIAAIAAAAGVAIGVRVVRAKSLHPTASITAPARIEPASTNAASPAPADPTPHVDSAPQGTPAQTTTAAPEAPPVASAAAENAPSAAASASTAPASADGAEPDARALREHALDLLKRAKNPEAMAAARAALDADPKDAMPYLVLGSALQDSGQWKQAHHTYELCVKMATKGMVDECRAMLHRR